MTTHGDFPLPAKNLGLNQQPQDQEAYARALAEDERYRSLSESLTRAHVLAARIRQQGGQHE